MTFIIYSVELAYLSSARKKSAHFNIFVYPKDINFLCLIVSLNFKKASVRMKIGKYKTYELYCIN